MYYMIKNLLLIVLALVVFNAAFVFLGGLDLLVSTKEEQAVIQEVMIDPDIVDVFKFTLEDEVKKKVGTPVEGYEPSMFLAAFPGLTETDFSGVEASTGVYEVINGQVRFKMDQTKLMHSASAAVTRKGMETLLHNVAKRGGIDLQTDGTITDVMSMIING